MKCELSSRLPPEESLDAIEALLVDEHVTFEREGDSIRSTRTPLYLWGLGWGFYSRKNWVGVNPFAFVSEVRVTAQGGWEDFTRLEVAVSETRAWFFFTLFVFWNVLISFMPPVDLSGQALWALLGVAGGAFVFVYPARSLVAKEISAALASKVESRTGKAPGEAVP